MPQADMPVCLPHSSSSSSSERSELLTLFENFPRVKLLLLNKSLQIPLPRPVNQHQTTQDSTSSASYDVIMADALKAEGNKLFAAKDFDGAV